MKNRIYFIFSREKIDKLIILRTKIALMDI